MFKIACNLENRTDKEIIVRLSIPQAEEPNIVVLDPNQSVTVFAGPDGSAPKIEIIQASGGE